MVRFIAAPVAGAQLESQVPTPRAADPIVVSRYLGSALSTIGSEALLLRDRVGGGRAETPTPVQIRWGG